MGPRVVARKHQRAAVRSPALCPRAESGQLFYRSTICISRVFLVCFQVARRGSDSPKFLALFWFWPSRGRADDGAADAEIADRHGIASEAARLPTAQAGASNRQHPPPGALAVLSLLQFDPLVAQQGQRRGQVRTRLRGRQPPNGSVCRDGDGHQYFTRGAAPWTAAWCSFSSMRIKGRRSWSAATRSTGDGCSIRKPRGYA